MRNKQKHIAHVSTVCDNIRLVIYVVYESTKEAWVSEFVCQISRLRKIANN